MQTLHFDRKMFHNGKTLIEKEKEKEQNAEQCTRLCKLAVQKDGRISAMRIIIYFIGEVFTHCSAACRVHLPLVVLFTKQIQINSHPGENFNCHFITIARNVKQRIWQKQTESKEIRDERKTEKKTTERRNK